MVWNQLPALLGVIVGAAASDLTASRMERSRRQREIATRWDDRRLAAYVEYMNAVKEIQRLASRIAADRGLDDHAEPLDPSEGLPLLAEADAARATTYETLVLLGDTETIAKAQALHRQVWRMEWYARARLQGNPEVWEQAFSDYKDARADFYRAARTSLGVAGGHVPRGQWPPAWQAGHSPE
jgi:hypothetical protein